MKTKAQKRSEARKQAETLKAKRKIFRDSNKTMSSTELKRKGKSLVPQTKKK